MTNEKELANEIVNNLLYYYAHAESDDRDGMDIALENLLDTVSKLVPAAKNLHEASANGLFDNLKCPECEDWTWNQMDLAEDGTVTVNGDCDHEWTLGKINLT